MPALYRAFEIKGPGLIEKPAGGGVVLGEYYGHHPDLLLQGTISTLPR
jgi:hypothetical protein